MDDEQRSTTQGKDHDPRTQQRNDVETHAWRNDELRARPGAEDALRPTLRCNARKHLSLPCSAAAHGRLGHEGKSLYVVRRQSRQASSANRSARSCEGAEFVGIREQTSAEANLRCLRWPLLFTFFARFLVCARCMGDVSESQEVETRAVLPKWYRSVSTFAWSAAHSGGAGCAIWKCLCTGCCSRSRSRT